VVGPPRDAEADLPGRRRGRRSGARPTSPRVAGAARRPPRSALAGPAGASTPSDGGPEARSRLDPPLGALL